MKVNPRVLIFILAVVFLILCFCGKTIEGNCNIRWGDVNIENTDGNVVDSISLYVEDTRNDQQIGNPSTIELSQQVKAEKCMVTTTDGTLTRNREIGIDGPEYTCANDIGYIFGSVSNLCASQDSKCIIPEELVSNVAVETRTGEGNYAASQHQDGYYEVSQNHLLRLTCSDSEQEPVNAPTSECIRETINGVSGYAKFSQPDNIIQKLRQCNADLSPENCLTLANVVGALPSSCEGDIFAGNTDPFTATTDRPTSECNMNYTQGGGWDNSYNMYSTEYPMDVFPRGTFNYDDCVSNAREYINDEEPEVVCTNQVKDIVNNTIVNGSDNLNGVDDVAGLLRNCNVSYDVDANGNPVPLLDSGR